MKKNNKYIGWGVTAFLVILASLIAYYVMYHFESLKDSITNIIVILMPIIDGVILAYILTPLLNALERKIVKPFFQFIHCSHKKKQLRMVSILLTTAVVIVVIYGFFSMAIPQIINSIKTIVYQFPTYVDTLTFWISQLLNDNPEIEGFVTDAISQYSVYIEDFINAKVLPQLNNIIMIISMSVYSIFKEFWNFIIGFIISIYVLGSKEIFAAQAKKILYAFLSVESANRLISNARFSNKTFCGFFVGKILDSIIIGIICFVVTSIMGTPFNVLISVIIGVTNIIPFFGPFLGAIPSILLILFIDPIQALYFLLFVLILQQVDGNIIGPKILGNSTGLSSFWVIFSITLFGGFLGVFGMIIGVPIFAVIFAFIKSLVESKLALKELPSETSSYLKLLYIDVEKKDVVAFSEDDKKPFSNITQILVKSQERLKHLENLKKQDSTNDNNDENNDTTIRKRQL